MKTIIFLLLANIAFAQSLQPTIGIRYTGGLSYGMEHEYPGYQAGILYTFKNDGKKINTTNLLFSAEYVNDKLQERFGKHSFYVLRIQGAREITKDWYITAYGGYINTFHNDIMYFFDGPYKSNFAYGAGVQLTDDHIIGEITLESLAGYPHLSIGVTYKFKSLINQNKQQ